MSDKFGVALTKVLCPICAKQVDGDIVMNTLLTKDMAKKVEALHGQVVGWKDEPCIECEEMLKQGIVLIGAVEAKTLKEDPQPYRSGNIWVVTEDYYVKVFGVVPPKRVAFIDVNAAQKLGLPDVKMDA